jgi:hypothetical protein
VIRIGAACEKECILPIAGVDLAFDFFTLKESTGAKPVKSVGEMVVDPIIAEHDSRWKLGTPAQRLSVLFEYVCRGPAFSLLNRRVGQDRRQGNAANFECGLGLAVWLHA